MKLKRRNIGIITGLSIVFAAASFLGTGCSNSSQGIRSSNIETEISASETISFDMENPNMEEFDMEPTGSEDVSKEEDVPVGETYFFEREDRISTMFYDLQIDGVTFTDAVGDVTAENERTFMILDVAITPCGDELVFSMYAQEFLMVCFTGDFVNQDYEKLYPLEEGLEEGQLGDKWLATVGEEIKGKLIYDIPKDALRTVLLVYDSYTTGDSNETVFGNGYMMTIPKENWSRETK